jgi:hypothetical protein
MTCNTNKNRNIKFSAHDAFLEKPSSDSQKVGKLNNLKRFGSK